MNIGEIGIVSPKLTAPESYAYDAEGNRTASHLSASYTHDTANRLREDEDACYAYDANGNLATKTAKVTGACTGGVTAYQWDVLNRLVRIDFPDATYAAYSYDAPGRRTEKDVNGDITRYVYDGDAILLEYDGADLLLATYSHGEEIDQPLAMTCGADSYLYGVDHLGSIRLVTDAAGAVANRYDYDAFGNLEPTSYETVSNPFGFTARERDAESGLMFYRARYYDPKIGRFISEDPIGFDAGDANLYRYVFNSSVMSTDPSGQAITVFQAQVAAVATVFLTALLVTGDVCVATVLSIATLFGAAGVAALEASAFSSVFVQLEAIIAHGTPVGFVAEAGFVPALC
jgi:RHS repeat-associated protein